ncbi:MAG: endolytic transglycosylase MltG [Lachnospiraceae bacterium]|nr:endolytic transglycosylase MltG [Lachnospiraceae bacterium]
MKLKYFIRGLGVGIIFGTIIMLVAHLKIDENNLSDSQIEARAGELGMVWPEETEATATDALTKVNSDGQTEASDIITEAVTEVKLTETEITTEVNTQITTEEKTTQATTEKDVFTEATITVTRGMSSAQVAELLENAGIIESAEDFDNYLISQGVSDKIQVNSYNFNSNMTYEEITNGLITTEEE